MRVAVIIRGGKRSEGNTAKLLSESVAYLVQGWVGVGRRGARGTMLTKERGYKCPLQGSHIITKQWVLKNMHSNK